MGVTKPVLSSHYMMRNLLITTLVIAVWLSEVAARGAFRQQFHEHDRHAYRVPGLDPGEPLMLTPLIQQGAIGMAQEMARVTNLPGSAQESYSGFLTVDAAHKSNMFFWFFPAQNKDPKAPVVLWLQGGPGGSSLFGLFVENGPYTIDENLQLLKKPVTWNDKYSMLYIDNPVGTGFSFTGDDAGYSTNESQVAVNLYSFLTQFFILFPKHAQNDFYVTGESYAGKYLPAISYHIMQQNKTNINLKGVAIGDGFTDPESMLPAYAPYLYNLGMLDENQAAYFGKQCDIAVELIKQKKFVEALAMWGVNLDFFQNSSGIHDNYNYLRTESPKEYDYHVDFLQLPQVRKAIHVGNLTYHAGTEVHKHLEGDMLDSVKPWLEQVMNKYRVLIYSGQLDIIVAQTLTEAMLQTMSWNGADAYKKASRSVWKVNKDDVEVAGYVRNVKDFYQVIVRAGGHILPYDQPERSYDMINRFISGKSF